MYYTRKEKEESYIKMVNSIIKDLKNRRSLLDNQIKYWGMKEEKHKKILKRLTGERNGNRY